MPRKMKVVDAEQSYDDVKDEVVVDPVVEQVAPTVESGDVPSDVLTVEFPSVDDGFETVNHKHKKAN